MFLVQELIITELVRRRKDQLNALKKGLQVLEFLPLLQRFKLQGKQLLSYKPPYISSKQLKSFLVSPDNENKSLSHAQSQPFGWLEMYIAESDGTVNEDFPKRKLNALFKFTTGMWHIPPIRKTIKISVEF